jgi:hypothetical protein
MDIKLLRTVAEEIGLAKFEEFGINKDSWDWKQKTLIDLTDLSEKKILKLRSIVDLYKNVRGTRIMIKDIDTWLCALKEGAGESRARSCRQFEPLLVRLIGQIPGHRIYKRTEEFEEIYLCYYVNEIQFHDEESRNGYRTPAYVSMELIYELFGGKGRSRIDFDIEDIKGKGTLEALAAKGFYPETDELRSAYLDQMVRFGKTTKQIGKQYLAKGTATDKDMDGNPSGRDSSWYWRRTHVYQMENESFPSRVLIDIFKETNEEEREREVDVSHYFWVVEANRRLIYQQIKKERRGKKKEDRGRNIEDLDREDMDEVVESLDVEPPEIEVPIHPYVAVFDLRRHLRLKTHVDYLAEYVYDPKISEKLILPKYLKDLVSMLIEYSGTSFGDIVEGKGGGAVVLLCGPPGTGKTLTAEVYAEAEQKGLYSVQCSQLGTDPENLEDELLKIFTRAQRWGAVLLLDEADVYVRSRGSDLQQNAIVGVFLRVLEYQNNVLFLTTNRPEDVDDAVASRCVARLNYKVPNAEDQAKIWKVLADISKIHLDDELVRQIVEDNSDVSGRDVKNLLKLACLISNSRKIPISVKVVRFVRQFKPTQAVVPNQIEGFEEEMPILRMPVMRGKFERRR